MSKIIATPKKDLTNKKFGKLTAIKYIKGSKWLCQCDCGNETIVSTEKLTTGRTKSCGCLRRLGYHYTHHLGKPDTYSHWVNIKTRCFNKNNRKYKNYGGRGITMCKEWKDNFKAFHEYVISLPNYKVEGYTSIDRIDNNGNYEPNNIRWATAKQQGCNKRNVTLITYKGKSQVAGDWAKELGIGEETIRKRLINGLPVEKILSKEKVVMKNVKPISTPS